MVTQTRSTHYTASTGEVRRLRRIGLERSTCLLVLVAALTSLLAYATPGTAQSSQLVPLLDLGQQNYFQFSGGLYGNGSNVVPADHAAEGLRRARRIQPLDVTGAPNPGGKYILLAIGMSNTTQEFCSSRGTSCHPASFLGQARTDPSVNTTSLVIIDGARGGQAASAWVSPRGAEYDRIRDTLLTSRGLGEQQVQIVWLKVANAGPRISLPLPQADAYTLEGAIANILRALHVRYPHLQQVFLSSRIYGGFATTALNPEPFAYESGFAVQWVIRAQIDQMRAGASSFDARAGDLNYGSTAPWAAWGPYLWAAGTMPRSDGLTWDRADFRSDGTHPSTSGVQKVGTMLLKFFTTSPFTKCWFVVGATCP